jgi:hypothetical protein
MEKENSMNEVGLDNGVKLSDGNGMPDEEVDYELKVLGLDEFYKKQNWSDDCEKSAIDRLNRECPKLSGWTSKERLVKDNVEFNPMRILVFPKEKRLELIKKYRLENSSVGVFENIIKNNGEYLEMMAKYSELKNGLLGIIDKDDIENEIKKLKEYISIKDDEYVNLLTECSLVRDKGYKRLENDDLYYTYFLTMEHCRNYVFESLGYIQIYGKDGLYNVNSKTVDGYRKSLNILKCLKVLRIKTLKGKETYTFESLDKYYFIDDRNKNHKLTWNPNKNKRFTDNKVDYFNEYTPIKYQGTEHGKDLSLVYYHIRHYLCSDNEPVYNYFISVIADMIRNPGRKLPICIVMNGEGGMGKSFLFDKLFRHLFGDMYGVRSNKVSGKFNRELENKVCFLIEELSHQDNKNESNIIKDMISNPKIRIERKGIDSYEVENCIRFFICSNGDWSIRIENNNSSRRYLVCDVCTEIPEPEHFNKLSELIKGDKRKGYENEQVLTETIEQFIFDMGKIDLSVLETDPPETESKKISQSYSKGIPEKQLETFFQTVISCEGYYDYVKQIKILDTDNDTEVKSNIFWNCFEQYLKDRRQPVPEGFSNYGRILSKWFGKDCSKVDTKIKDGKRNRILTFPKIEVVEGILDLV